MLSRKYYIMIARVISDSTIKQQGNNIIHIDKGLLLYDLCYQLEQDNNLFNKDRFIDACND